MKYPGFSKRFVQMCKERNAPDNQTELGKLLGVSQSLIAYWKNGNRLPTLENGIIAADYLGCNVEWLLTGKGEKYPNIKNEMLLDISKLSEKDREIVKALVKSLETQQPKEVEPAKTAIHAQNKITLKPVLINRAISNHEPRA